MLKMLTVRSGLLAVSCCGLVVPGARNIHMHGKMNLPLEVSRSIEIC